MTNVRRVAGKPVGRSNPDLYMRVFREKNIRGDQTDSPGQFNVNLSFSAEL
jgi:hypothetical protein